MSPWQATALGGLVALTVTGAWGAYRFRSRNNPESVAGLVGWYFLAGVGLLIVAGGWAGLLFSLRGVR